MLSLRRFFIVLVVFCLSGLPVYAQQAAKRNVFELQARALDSVTVKSNQWTIMLWGVMPIENSSAQFFLRARTSLDDLIGSAAISCETKGQAAGIVVAQCLNAEGRDLALNMLQRGLVSVDRAVVYDTVFEQPYLEAEREAQKDKLGIWSKSEGGNAGEYAEISKLIVFSLIMLAIAALIFIVLGITLWRGIKQSIAAQDRNASLTLKERDLRQKEKKIVATMLYAELESNRSKTEAYISVYDETLTSLKNPNITPTYQQMGDMVQMQPALDRSVFDGNTDKMDLLGRDLAREIIHFYARIKTHPDYENLDADTPLAEATETVESAVENAKKLNTILDGILQNFVNKKLVD